MIVTVFRLRPSSDPEMLLEYKRYAEELNAIVPTIPGYVSHKRFVADDGERCTIVEFEDEAALRVWSQHPRHLEAKAFGKTFFTDYDIKICDMKYRLGKPSK